MPRKPSRATALVVVAAEKEASVVNEGEPLSVSETMLVEKLLLPPVMLIVLAKVVP
jgi:hypothetical protein